MDAMTRRLTSFSIVMLFILLFGCIYGKLPPFTESDVKDCVEKNSLDYCIAKCDQLGFPSGIAYNNCYYWTVNQTLNQYGKDNATINAQISPLCEKIDLVVQFGPTKQNCYDLFE